MHASTRMMIHDISELEFVNWTTQSDTDVILMHGMGVGVGLD